LQLITNTVAYYVHYQKIASNGFSTSQTLKIALLLAHDKMNKQLKHVKTQKTSTR